MKSSTRLLALLACLALLFVGGACELEVVDEGPGPDPVAPDRDITCGHFDDFAAVCFGDCNVSWDCELTYDELSVADQIALDACSDCLAENLADGYCDDCTIPEEGIDSCQLFMEDLLGVECWD